MKFNFLAFIFFLPALTFAKFNERPGICNEYYKGSSKYTCCENEKDLDLNSCTDISVKGHFSCCIEDQFETIKKETQSIEDEVFEKIAY